MDVCVLATGAAQSTVPTCRMCLQGILCSGNNCTMCCAVLCGAVPASTQAFKAAERRMTEAQVLQELALDKACLEQLPRKVKEALWKGGVPAMLKAGLTRPQIQRLRGGGLTNQQLQQGQEQGGQDLAAASASSSSSRAEAEGQDTATSSSEASTSGSGSGSDSDSDSRSSAYGPYLKRQHLFVAATMPALTKADVGKELQKRFPEALWVSGEMLHQVGGWAGAVLLLGR